MAKNYAAIIPQAKAQLEVVEREMPKPAAEEVLVKNKLIAINPVDWKMQDYGLFVNKYPNVLGSDIVGDVVAVGSNVTRFKVGDRVLGFASVIATNNPDHGAFQDYTLLGEHVTTKVPGNLTDEQAVVLPMQVATAGDSLFRALRLPLFGAAESAADAHDGMLIWGGTSSMGIGVVQMAKQLGFKTYVTASARNHAYLKSIGADYLFDYNDANVTDAIAQLAKKNGDRFRYCVDCISEGEPNTSGLCAKVLAVAGDKPKLVVLLPVPEGVEIPAEIEVVSTYALNMYQDEKAIGSFLFNEWLPRVLADGSYKAGPEAQYVGSGLKDVQTAFEVLKKGVSGKKIVVPLA